MILKFIKVRDKEQGKDVVHIWIEDDADSALQKRLLEALVVYDPIEPEYEVVERVFEKREERVWHPAHVR